jgi:hypothetical protein
MTYDRAADLLLLLLLLPRAVLVPEVVRLFFGGLRFCVWGPAAFVKN